MTKVEIAQQLYGVWDTVGDDAFYKELKTSGLTPEEYKAIRIRTGHSGTPLNDIDISNVPLEVYAHSGWDPTDEEEVVLINKALSIAEQPLHAMDCVIDTGNKLLSLLEATANNGVVLYAQVDKMTMMHSQLQSLVDRLEEIRFKAVNTY